MTKTNEPPAKDGLAEKIADAIYGIDDVNFQLTAIRKVLDVRLP